MNNIIDKEEFYQWAYSDLLLNIQRGYLAEFIIATALGISSYKKVEYSSFDLEYKNVKIEVKSVAYIQTWEQKDFSPIRFNITKRNSDIYALCLLKHKDRNTINPLLVEQWDFYLIPTSDVNFYFQERKTIALSVLEKKVYPISFNEIKHYMDSFLYNL